MISWRTSAKHRATCIRLGALCVVMIAGGCATTSGHANPGATGTVREGAHEPPPRGNETAPAGTGTGTGSPRSPTTTVPTTSTTSSAATASSGLSLLVEPQAGMAPLYALMSSAKQSLDMAMYELSDPTAEQILVSDHERSVRVRVLLDHSYDGGSVNQAAFSTLSAAGVPVAWSNDSEIFHQKTITVDDEESAIMTGNLTSQYYTTTRDFVVMDHQAADVAAVEAVFTSDWSGSAPVPGPVGADLVWSPGSEAQLVSLISSASRSVVVENEEMDSGAIEEALESDAGRGVDVTVVMTADSDWDSAFSRLESAGVHVVLYPDTDSALYIHAKVIDVDGRERLCGLGELLYGQPRLQPRAGDHHHIFGRPRAVEQHALERRERSRVPLRPGFDLAVVQSCGTRGSERSRRPTAAKTAFAMAGATVTIGVSPAPAAGNSLASSSTTSMSGTSPKRGTR